MVVVFGLANRLPDCLLLIGLPIPGLTFIVHAET